MIYLLIRIGDRIKRIDLLCYNKTCGGQFFGVYDGHGGDKVSSYLKDNLHKQFADCLE